MHASKQSEEVGQKRHLRMVDNRHANVQSVGTEEGLLVPKLKRFEGKHAGKFRSVTHDIALKCFYCFAGGGVCRTSGDYAHNHRCSFSCL